MWFVPLSNANNLRFSQSSVVVSLPILDTISVDRVLNVIQMGSIQKMLRIAAFYIITRMPSFLGYTPISKLK